MGILRKYLWLVLPIVFFANYASANTCENDPYACTPAKLCSKTTEKINNVLYWISSEEDKHLKVARKINLNCGAKDAMSSCQKDASECSILELCEVAAMEEVSAINWNEINPQHVKLAKSFGLDCGVKEVQGINKVNKINSNTAKSPCDVNPLACKSEELCEKATYGVVGNKNWTTPKVFADFVKEAKQRGLTCGVKSTSIDKTCSQDVLNCTPAELCETATYNINGITGWKLGSYKKFVDEAKRRNISCGVNLDKKSSVSNKTTLIRKKVNTSKARCEADLKGCTDYDLCMTATFKVASMPKNWKLGSYKKFVDEAKRRNISCGVKSASNDQVKADEKARLALKAEKKRKADEKAKLALKAEKKRKADEKARLALETKKNSPQLSFEMTPEYEKALSLVDNKILEDLALFKLMKDFPACPPTKPFDNCFGAETISADVLRIALWKSNAAWTGIEIENGIYNAYYFKGTFFPIGSCKQEILSTKKSFYYCPNGDKFRSLEASENKDNAGKLIPVVLTKADGSTKIRDDRHGRWYFEWVSGNVYEGEYLKNQRSGKGIYKWANGDVYEGDYQNGQRTGKGIYKSANGNVYEGDYQNGQRTGKGIFKWANGDVYEGDYQNGQRTGKGIYKSANGDVYEGDFLNAQRTGKGIYKWANGNVYEGDWLNNQKSGKGIFKWANGDVYEGDWLNGQQTGKGIFKWANGDVSKGDWLNGYLQ